MRSTVVWETQWFTIGRRPANESDLTAQFICSCQMGENCQCQISLDKRLHNSTENLTNKSRRFSSIFDTTMKRAELRGLSIDNFPNQVALSFAELGYIWTIERLSRRSLNKLTSPSG